MKNNINLILFMLIAITLNGQSILDPDNIVVGANALPSATSSDSVFYFHKGTMSWRAGLFENGIAAPSPGRKWSAAWGRNNNISGNFSSGWGKDNSTSSMFNTTWGELNTVLGNYSTAWGKSNQTIKTYSTVWGFHNFLNAQYSTAWGRLNMLTGSDITAFGYNNSAIGQDITIWGRENTATDTLSTVWGGKNEATGGGSTAWGGENKAIGNLSTVWGGESQAKGPLTTAWGLGNQADSIGATAWGVLNKSLNYQATAWGKENKAFGIHSTVMGQGNGTFGLNSTVVGQYNIFFEGGFNAPPFDGELIIIYTDKFGNKFYNDDFHKLFVVGNGDDVNNRSNAITVTKSGRLGIGVDLPASALNLASSEELRFGPRTSISGDSLSIITNSPILPTTDAKLDLGSSSKRWQTVYAESGIVTTSDIRLKENIIPVTEALHKVNSLTPISYNLISHPEKRTIGFSAQALQSVIPEAVYKDSYITEDGIEDYHYGVNYDELIPILTKAIQEQQTQIVQSTKQNEMLQARIENLENTISKYSK